MLPLRWLEGKRQQDHGNLGDDDKRDAVPEFLVLCFVVPDAHAQPGSEAPTEDGHP